MSSSAEVVSVSTSLEELFSRPGPGYHSVLLASHGTPGAQTAERLALRQCQAGGVLHHLLVVPDLWRGMMGDDWLNNVRTRMRFGDYLEGEIGREVDGHLARMEQLCAKAALDYRPRVQVGEPTDCLLGLMAEVNHDLLVMGAPRPKGTPGLRSRMRTDRIVCGLKAPILVAAPGG